MAYGIFNLMSQERVEDNERSPFKPIELQAGWGQTVYPLNSLSPETWALFGQPVYRAVDEDNRFLLARDCLQAIEVNFTDIQPDGPAALFRMILAPLDQGLAVSLLEGMTPDHPQARIPLVPLDLDFRLTVTPDGTSKGLWTFHNSIFVMRAKPSWVSSEFIGDETQWRDQYELSGVSFTMFIGGMKCDWTPRAGDVPHGEKEGGASVFGFKSEIRINNTLVQPEDWGFYLPHNAQVPELISLTAHRQI